MATDTSFVGMSGFSQNNTYRGTQSATDKKMGNPNGDVVDRSPTNNPVDGSAVGETVVKPTQNQGSSGKGYLRNMSMPKSLADTLMNS